MTDVPLYKTRKTSESQRVLFLFESSGLKKIVKAVIYSPVGDVDGTMVYNLGFGDYDEALGTIVDDVNSNNGDMYPVFNTVLSTVPTFFNDYKEAVIMVSGSDSHDDFKDNCLPNCRKRCEGTCRNFQRRIRTYRYFVNKHFEELVEEYIFFGRIKSGTNTFVQYVPGHEYDDILVYKKK